MTHPHWQFFYFYMIFKQYCVYILAYSVRHLLARIFNYVTLFLFYMNETNVTNKQI